MDDASKTMIKNLTTKTGKPLEEWVEIVQKENFEKHGEIIKYLKENHGFTHGFANLVAHKARKSDAGSITDKDAMITAQYQGKEHFLPIYESLIETISAFGPDVTFAPKKAYMSLRRKKQFGMLMPATKTRFEIGLNLKDATPNEYLIPITSKNAMFTHKINLAADDETGKVTDLLRQAYEQAG